MSVIAYVRSISEDLHDELRERPEIATRLALEREAIDFERATFVAAQPAKALERANVRADALEKEHASVWMELAAANVRRSDVDAAFEVGRAGSGLRWAFAGSRVRLFDEDAGIAVGDDVGYGPSRLFTPGETKTMYDEMLSLPLTTFASQYARGSEPFPGDPYAGFEAVIVARIALANYLQVAKVSWRALLVWSE